MPVKAVPASVRIENPWSYTFTPYFWMPSLKGSSTIKGHTENIDATFIDFLHRQIPKELFGLMGTFEARNDRFSVYADAVYMMLVASKGAAKSISFGPGGTINASLTASASVKLQMAIVEAAATYEIFRWGSRTTSNTAIDVYGGGRFWWQKADADVDVSAVVGLSGFSVSGNRAFANSGDITWVDPIIGLRLRHQFVPGHQIVLSGDVGGFGVGSQFSWQDMGAYKWDFAKTQNVTWSGLIGYRALSVDYSKSSNGVTSYAYDMLQHGPTIGLNLRF